MNIFKWLKKRKKEQRTKSQQIPADAKVTKTPGTQNKIVEYTKSKEPEYVAGYDPYRSDLSVNPVYLLNTQFYYDEPPKEDSKSSDTDSGHSHGTWSDHHTPSYDSSSSSDSFSDSSSSSFSDSSSFDSSSSSSGGDW